MLHRARCRPRERSPAREEAKRQGVSEAPRFELKRPKTHLVSLQRGQANGLATLSHRRILATRREHGLESRHIPHLERLVQTPTNKKLSIGGEGDRVNRILMPLELIQQLPTTGIPNPHDGIERTSRKELAIGAHDDRGDSRVDGSILGDRHIVNGERVDAAARLHVPHASRLVARTGNETTAVGREGEGVDLGLVALENLGDALLSNVPDLLRERRGCQRSWREAAEDQMYADDAILGSSRQKLAVGAEGSASDVVVGLNTGRLVREDPTRGKEGVSRPTRDRRRRKERRTRSWLPSWYRKA
jgi:hypothetical protein